MSAQPLTPRQKDPRKVEAGRKGAAARKAKQEQLHAQLLEAKAALKQPSEPTPDHVTAVSAHTHELHGADDDTDSYQLQGGGAVVSKSRPSDMDWIRRHVVVIGGVGLSAVALWYWSQSSIQPRGYADHHRGGGGAAATRPSNSATPAVTSTHLKTGSNPFHML